MQPQLSAGVIQAFYNGIEWTDKAILQVAKIEDITKNDKVRTRTIFSDGVNSIQGMLTSQAQEDLQNAGHALKANSIVHLKVHTINQVHGKKILIAVNVEWLADSGALIGSPQPIESAGTQAQQVQQTTTPAVPVQQSSFQKPPQSSFGGSETGGIGTVGQIYPISQLNPYQNKWTIRARVTNKSEIRHYNNAKGAGKLMSVDLLDNQGGEIRATMFNETLDKFAPILKKGSVYLISGGSLKGANKRYSNLNNEYELTFGSSTRLELCPDPGDIKTMQYDFIPIDSIQQKQKDDIVDVLAVITSVGDLDSITTRKGDPLAKRVVVLVDQSARTIDLTLWGSIAENFSAAGAPVIACKCLRVSDYANRSLSTMNGSNIEMSPTIPEATTLKHWYDKQGGIAHITTYPMSVAGGGGGGSAPAEFKALGEVLSENLGMKTAEVFECEVVVTLLRHEGTWMYNACPKDGCKKKVTQDHNNGWRCEKCGTSYDRCDPRYVISMTASDATGKLWFSLFNDEATMLLGCTASDLVNIQQTDPKRFDAVFEDALYKTVRMKVKARAETYNETEKVKYNVLSINAVDWALASSELVSKLAALGISA